MLMLSLVGPKKAKEVFLPEMDDLPTDEALRLSTFKRVLPADQVLAAAIRAAVQMAAVDPLVVRRTKQAENATVRTMGMNRALEDALAPDPDIEGEGRPDTVEFLRHLREGGLKAT